MKLNFKANDKKVFIIAEAGSTHNRNLNKIKKLINVAAECGADAIKFQSFFADEIATKNRKYNIIKNKFRKYSKNLYDFYKKLELPKEKYSEIIKHCKKKNIIFMSSAFGAKSFNNIRNIVPIYKVSSFEINYFEFIDEIIKNNKPTIFSTGSSDEKEIKKLVFYLKKKKFNKFSLLHCSSSYPLDIRKANLRYILRLKKIFKGVTIGYSDHTTGISASVAAVSLGARIIEKHFTISKKDKNPDSFFSLEPEELKLMITLIRETEQSLGEQKKFLDKDISEIRKSGMRSYYATKNFIKGTTLKKNMFIALRPSVKKAMPVEDIKKFFGKKIKKNIYKDQVLLSKHLK